MSAIRIPFTGHELYITDDQPALYLSGGFGNNPRTNEVHLHLYDPETGDDRPLGWVDLDKLQAALTAIAVAR